MNTVPIKPTPEQIKSAQIEAWHRGKLDWKLKPVQRHIDQVYNSVTAQLFVGNCSRQLGKSYWAVVKAVSFAIKNPKSQIRYGSAFYTELSEFIIPAFEKVMEDCPPSIKGKYKSQGQKFVFPNGSVIKLVGIDKNPNGLRGNALDLIILDEVAFIANLDYVYKSVIIPTTTRRPNCKIIMISTPPATPAHAFVKYVSKAQLEKAYAKFTIHDDVTMTDENIARLAKEQGGVESTTWRREYLCEFVLDDNHALVREWKDTMIGSVPKDQYYQYYHKYVGMDMGRKDMTALVFGYYDFKAATLYIEDEITMEGTTWTTVSLKDAVIAKEKELWDEMKPFRRVADNNNPHLIMDLNQLHGVHFLETNKESLEAMVNEVRLLVGAGRIIVNPKCLKTIGCLQFGIWDKNRKEFERSEDYGHFDHFAALMYLVRNMATNSNPIPTTHGHTNDRSWLGNVDRNNHSENAKTIAKMLMRKRTK